MPLFLNQFTYTADAWATLMRHPADRTEVVRTLIEQMGGRLVGMHYSFGEYDGVMLVEAPDEHAISSALIAAIAPGHIKAMKTTTLITAEAMVDVLRRAADLFFSGPARDVDRRLDGPTTPSGTNGRNERHSGES